MKVFQKVNNQQKNGQETKNEYFRYFHIKHLTDDQNARFG